MRKAFLLGVLALAALVSCNKGGDDPRLVIITFDGLRWQELYGGADEALVNDSRFVGNVNALKAKYWRETAEERREALMPFLWSYAPEHGYMLGNRTKNSRMQVDNTGYSEMFCGWADNERVDSNDPVPNPNVSVMEVVNQDPRYKGKVMMYSSWESIRFAMNNDRGGFPGSSGHEPSYTDTRAARMMQDVDAGVPDRGFGDSERLDCITFGMAFETLQQEHPKVFYVGFGDTDEYAHEGAYDHYLDAVHWTDLYIRRIVEYCESDPFYQGKQTWFVAFGKGIPVLGETSDNGVFYTKQFAATIADILGVDFTPGNGVKCEPFDPALLNEEAKPEYISLPAVKATPKGKGLLYSYTEGDFMSCKEVLAAPVKKKGLVPVFGTDGVKQREDHFGIVFNGLMKIDQEGEYVLSICTDDGSKGWLDGRLIWDVDRDGGGFKDIYLKLEAGYHRLEVQYFENYGGDEVTIGLEGPGIAVDNLPASMLYYE